MLFIPDTDYKVTHYSSGVVIGKMLTGNTFTRENELLASFTGLQQLYDYSTEHMPVVKQEKASDIKGRDGSFYYFTSYQEALDTYQQHPEKVTEFTENDLQLKGGDAAGLDITYDVTGDFIDIDRYLSGEPENFGNMYNGNPRGQRVTIVYGIAWGGNTEKSVLNERSTRILRLADWLESQGVRVQIVAISSMECQHVEVTVKHYDEPVSLTDIAVTAHSDYFRRLIFRFAEYSDTWRDGYGSSLSFDSFMRNNTYKDMPEILRDGHIVYCGVQRESNMEQVFTNTEKQLADLLANPQAKPQLLKVMV